MTGAGLRQVANPSELLIPQHEDGLSGTAVSAMLDGNRPFMFEVQALVSSAVYGTAQRSATGFEVVVAVLSSNFDYAIPNDVCFAGEVGLSGEIRPVSQAERRAVEAARLGFKRIFVSSYTRFDRKPEGIEVVKVADIPALVKSLFR